MTKYQSIFTIFLTHKCNLKCEYCYRSRKQQRNDLTEDLLYKAIDYSIQHNFDNIVFFGGEPLIKKDLILKGISYYTLSMKKSNSSCQLVSMTNGRLFTEDFVKQIESDQITFLISVDSYDDIKNLDSVKDKLNLLNKYKISFNIQYTITPNNSSKMYKSYLQAKRYSTCFAFRPICEFDLFTKESIDSMYEECVKIAEDATKSGIYIKMFPGKCSPNRQTYRESYCCAKMPLNYSLTMDTDGTLYGCEEDLENQENSFGDIAHGVIHNPYIKCNSLSHSTCLRKKICNPYFDQTCDKLDLYMLKLRKARELLL